MNLLEVATLLVVAAAAFGTINYFVFRLPASIGILAVALLASVLVMVADRLFPGLGLGERVRAVVTTIRFDSALLEGMLGLLLFAGALHVKLSDLRAHWRVVLLMATIGVGISTAVIGFGFSAATGMPLLVALVFGALISPTDPVAVLGVLRDAALRKSLETKIAGESLFNDGVGYVVFLVLLGLAFPTGSPAADHGGASPGLATAALLFLQEAGGGVALGAVLGWLVFRVMRRIDDYALEVLITLALAMGGYALAQRLHVSAPLMAVFAGLFIGDVGMRHAMSEQTRHYVEAFWKLVDEILNAVLFLMIGVEVFAVTFGADALLAAAAAVALSLVGRLAAVVVPILLLRPFRSFSPGIVPIMTWGGLKGGISVALALSLPDSEWKPTILAATYVVVVFSILVQGLTIGRVARRFGRAPELL